MERPWYIKLTSLIIYILKIKTEQGILKQLDTPFELRTALVADLK